MRGGVRRTRRAWIFAGLAAVVGLAIAVVLIHRPPDNAATAPVVPVWTPVTVAELAHGRFEHLNVYAPHGVPRGVVQLLSDAEGWTPEMVTLADGIARQGAMVIGIDSAALTATLEADGASCVFPDGDLENLSRYIQAYYRLPGYLPPILVGQGAGAAFAYAVFAQAPAQTFAGALSLDFCPVLTLRKPFCKAASLGFAAGPGAAGTALGPVAGLAGPWVVVPHVGPAGAVAAQPGCDAATVGRFVAQVPGAEFLADPGQGLAAIGKLIARNAPAPADALPAALADLPLVIAPVPSGVAPGGMLAIMLSGDGGWAGLDKEVAAALNTAGVTVIGLDSLRYFWGARTPEGLAADLERIIGAYGGKSAPQGVALIGYSQGADVLPFAVNRLSEASRSRIKLAALLGISTHAVFEFHLGNWVSDDNSGPATLPEIERMNGVRILCVYGADEADSPCAKLDPRRITVTKLPGGHHFDGDYGSLARAILAAAS